MRKKYANRVLHSDVQPFEVIREVSGKCLEVRQMTATMVQAAKLLAAGGFMGNFDNSVQEWKCESQPNYPIERIRQRKDGSWKSSDGSLFILADQPRNFRDWNF